MATNGKGKAVAGKGKAVASKGSSGKRKRDDDKTGGRKRTNPAVLQFFEDSAAEASDYDTSDFEEDFRDDDDEELQKPTEPHKSQKAPVKEEELSGDELERVLEERYKSGSGYVRYAEDDYETKRVDKNFGVPSAPEPVIWKVKCKIGRERQTIFCLMQKFVDLKALGTKLQIVSAFSVEHVRGFIFVEANKQFEVMEACKQLPDVYYSMITHVPSSEFSQMLAVRKKKTEVSKGMWVRVKSGNYKGDLGQVVAVGDSRKKATLKLIPRVDFQALAAKFGAGSSIKRSAVPKPRLIASSDLEEFRPLIQSRRDRDTGMHFEVLDGMMLKDGFLFKKVSVDSLRICDVNPSIEELQKFRTSTNEDSGNVEFLSQLYGDKKDKPTLKPVQVGGKGEGTSGSKEQEDIEVHDLVLFGKREFGMVIGMEKDESYKILKYGLEGSVVVSLAKKDLKNLNLEKKFNALDHRMKTIFANDVVKILDGPLKDKEGVVKQIYRGIIFLYDQNDMEDNAYFCAKSQSCEKVKHNDDICLGKDGEAGPSGCEDLPSSPKTPLSPEKPWQTEEQSRNFNRREQQDGEFSVGQSLRIRVGPLKGYLCRVLAVRRSDVTVKLDSRQKVLTVKSEHLSEVRGKSFATSTCDDTGLDSSRPFDFLGNNAGGNDWMAGSVQNNDKNEEGQSNEGSSWPAFTSSAPSLPWGASSGDTSAPTEDDPWQKKPSTTHEGGSSWGQEVKTDIPSVPQNDTSSSWDRGKTVTGGTSSWGNLDGGSSWGQEVKTDIPSIPKDASSSWDKGKTVVGGTSSWGNLASEKDNEKGSSDSAKQWASEPSDSAGWGQQKSSENTGSASQNAWDQSKSSQDKGTNPAQDSWGKAAGDTWGSKCDPSGTKDWTNPSPASDSQNARWDAGGSSSQTDGNSWGKPKSSSGGTSWSKSDLTQQDGSAQNEGWAVGGGSGERSSGTAAWDNGNSGSSGWGQQKSWGKSSETGPNTEGASDGKWGNFKVGDASDRQQDNWKKPNSSGAEGGAPSWGNSSGKGAWGQSSRSDNDQEFSGGRGFGGRRGRGNGGRFDQSGRGRGRSSGRGQFSSWNNEGQDEPSSDRGIGYGDSGSSGKGWSSDRGSWGNHNQGGSSGEGKTWNNDQGWNEGKGASDQDTSSGWKQGGSSQNTLVERSSEPAAGWNSGSSGWGQEKPSEGTADGNSSGGWGSAVEGWAKKSGSSEGKEWKSSSDASGVKTGGWGDSSGKWAAQKEDNGSSWNASAGNDSWGNNQGRGGGGRGDFGGRRGRGGFRGGRDQSGRGRGGRSFGGRQSWNSGGEDKPSWGGSSGGGNYNQGGGGGSGGWAKEKGGGGGWGNNDKGGSDGGNGWGTSGGNGGGGWAKEKGGGGGGWGNNDKGGSDGGSGWGASGGNGGGGWAKEKDGGGGGWGNNDKGGSDGGSGWGTSGGNGGGGGWAKEKGVGSGWGASGVTNEGSSGGGSGWGSSSAGKAATAGLGGSEASGEDKTAGNGGGGKKDQGGGSAWGASGVTNEGSSSGGSGWGSSSAGKAATAGWGGSEASGEDKTAGNGGGGKKDQGGGTGWGASGVTNEGSSGGGSVWGSSSAGKAATAGWGGSEASGEDKTAGNGGGGWGGGKKDQGGGGGW